MVPVLRHTPPSMSGRSTIATRRSSLAAAIAAFWPPGPEPITSTSKSYTMSSLTSATTLRKSFAALGQDQADDCPLCCARCRITGGPMYPPSRDEYFAEIEASAARLAEIVSTRDPDLPVPTCPDWTLSQLAAHVGRVHRWAAEIVTTRATESIPFESVPDSKYPATAADQVTWINAGAARVVDAIVAADDEPVWAFGRQAPASFWARRQAHETAMHRIDAEMAVGRPVVLDARI